jgi:23S rRNA maturation-related 3'-5' exoribonuclease YhaM
MARLPKIAELTPNLSGWGFFLCTRKETRSGRTGNEFLEVGLTDVSGEIGAKVFQDVDAIKLEFDAGEFVKAQGRSNLYQGRTELILDKIRRGDSRTVTRLTDSAKTSASSARHDRSTSCGRN